MHLIAPLAAGIAGAESGTVDIYRRGTSTRATYYTDFEATSAVTPTASISLDANGGGIFYVNELVQCVVKTSAGTTLRTFVAGDAAGGIEVTSPSFTGTDYTTGASAANKPTTLQAVLDRWYDSAGTTNFQVLLGGAATDLDTAFTNLSGVVYNVKGYGAVGNGTTDDRAAIVAAVAAAAAAGGGTVFFPAGTYRISDRVDVGATVNLMGAGANCTTLKIDNATAAILKLGTGPAAAPGTVRGLTFTGAAGSLPNVFFDNAVVVNVSFEECAFVGVANSTALVSASSGTGRVSFSHCAFSPVSTAVGSCAFSGSATCPGYFYDCKFITPATYNPTNGMLQGQNLWLYGCEFDNSACTSGTFACVNYSSAATGEIVGCKFGADGGAGATSTAITLGVLAAGSSFYESGNIFATDTAFSYTAAAAQGQVTLDSRDKRAGTLSLNAAATLDADEYGVIVATQTGNASFTLNADLAPPGTTFTLIWRNGSGGAGGTITPGANLRMAVANWTTANGLLEVFRFRSANINGTLLWVQEATGLSEL